MSDTPAGWAELLAAPLGPEPPEATSLATLLCLQAPLDAPGASSHRLAAEER